MATPPRSRGDTVRRQRDGGNGNDFRVTIHWAWRKTVRVELATDAADLVWTPLATLHLADGSATFTDAEWTNHPQRFYRTVEGDFKT